jgi:hypothetical protein
MGLPTPGTRATSKYIVSDLCVYIHKCRVHCHTLPRALQHTTTHRLPHTAAHCRAHRRSQPRTLPHSRITAHCRTAALPHCLTLTCASITVIHYQAHCCTLLPKRAGHNIWIHIVSDVVQEGAVWPLHTVRYWYIAAGGTSRLVCTPYGYILRAIWWRRGLFGLIYSPPYIIHNRATG